MSKTKLYVALDGPILLDRTAEHPIERLAEYAKPFMHWAAQHFDVRLLTDRDAATAFGVLGDLGLKRDTVPVHLFDTSKIEVVPRGEKFFWVDSDLIPGEASWLLQHNLQDHFLHVRPDVGVTEEHKKFLEKHLNPRK